MFSHRLPVAEAYVDLLAGPGTIRGLMGPREVPRLWERHVLNCAVVTDAIAEGSTVCDLGSGAGLPGLVLAIRRPDLQVTLVEPLLRRTTFLEEAVAELGLDNVEVVRGRADALHGKRTFDVVTSRAVAALSVLSTWSLPLVRVGGVMLAMKGSSAAEEIEEARAALDSLGAGRVDVLTVGEELLDIPTTLVRVEARRAATIGLPSARRTKSSSPRRKRNPRSTKEP